MDTINLHDIIKDISGIDMKYEAVVGDMVFDLGYNNLVIDLNPTISHNSTKGYKDLRKTGTNEPIDPMHHFERQKKAEELGFECIQIFDFTEGSIGIVVNKLKKLGYIEDITYDLVLKKIPDVKEIRFDKPNKHFQKCCGENVYVYDAGIIYIVEADEQKVENIENLDICENSYDVETASDKFMLSHVVSHNCRTRVYGNINGDSICPGRGNFSFTTINLPRLGIEAKGDWNKFFTKLDYMMDLAKEQLEARYDIIAHKHVYNFPFAFGQKIYYGSENLNPNDEIKEALKNSSLSIGFIGLAECMVAMTGHHHGEGKQYYDQAVDIIKHMRERTDRYTADTHMNWSLFATPAEGLSSRFTRIDKKRYGEIKGVTDRDYYTNSFHIPVYFDITAGKKMELEGTFHELCNAGAITYVEANGDFTKNLEAFEDLVKYGLKCGLNYFAINHPVDSCPVCGYTGIIDDVCPCCGFKDGDTEMDYDKLVELQRKGMLKNVQFTFENNINERGCSACHEIGE